MPRIAKSVSFAWTPRVDCLEMKIIWCDKCLVAVGIATYIFLMQMADLFGEISLGLMLDARHWHQMIEVMNDVVVIFDLSSVFADNKRG
jgi:hypothetical protein